MDFNKKTVLVNAFFMSQFSCCPLIWMRYNRTKNNKTHRIHERCLRLICNDKKSSFEKINLPLYTTETLGVLQSECTNYNMVFHWNFKVIYSL